MYHLKISGESASRKAIIASVILSDIYRKTVVLHRRDTETILFRFRGDARLVLRKVARDLTGKKPSRCDHLEYGGAVACVEKAAS